jgi:hypothetical protein
MFYPKCPECGGATSSLESNIEVPHAHAVAHGLKHVAKSHPVLGAIVAGGFVAVGVGESVYKRFPGGGNKICGNCGHKFR